MHHVRVYRDVVEKWAYSWAIRLADAVKQQENIILATHGNPMTLIPDDTEAMLAAAKAKFDDAFGIRKSEYNALVSKFQSEYTSASTSGQTDHTSALAAAKAKFEAEDAARKDVQTKRMADKLAKDKEEVDKLRPAEPRDYEQEATDQVNKSTEEIKAVLECIKRS